MASSSSAHSSSQSPKKYDVFISFRGEDTRFNFTSHLHDALRRNQLDTYIDYRLEKGDEVWPSLERAIEDSTLFLVIFSENYASSTWCLKELTKIFDCSKNQDHLTIPVFYRVDPSHVRKQSGSYQKAFEEHENKGINKHQMQIWREALTHAANLAGWDCSLDKNEAELVKEIMNCVVTKLGPRRSDDSLITAWILFRYLFIGLYVGCATVGIFIIWYTHGSFLGIDLTQDNHSLVTYSQLANWGQCSSWKNFTASPFTAGDKVISFGNSPCDYFKTGNVKATTLSLSVLVAMKKFNSLNALSEDGSLLTMPPWEIPWLLLAMSLSFGMHFLVFYVPFLAQTFGIVPLTLNEWLLVLVIACPVLLIDEELKFCGEVYKRVSNFQIEDESRVDN